MYWIVGQAAVVLLRACGTSAAVLSAAFGGANGAVMSPPGVPPDIGTETVVVKSIASANALVANPTGATYAVLDIEKWPATPQTEWEHPVTTIHTISTILAPLHLKLIAAPSVTTVGSWQTYLSRHLTDAAKYTWGFDIQAQSLENDATTYTTFVRRAAAQIRSIAPKEVIYRGLTTDQRNGPVDGKLLYNLISATNAYANGVWLNVPGGPDDNCPNCGPDNSVAASKLLYRLYGAGSR